MKSRLQWLAIALALQLVAAADTARGEDRLPNIILITVDTFRPDRLGYYGHLRDTSPHLDRFSAEGLFFTEAFATSAWTTPGLISLHTSLHAPAHGVDIRGRSLSPNVETLADVLRAGGYRAPDIFFLTDVPNFRNLGFEPYGGRSRYLRQGDEILFQWLEKEAGRGAEPFFLYYHYRDLHQPYNPGTPYEELYTEESFGHWLNPLSWLGPILAREKMDGVKREVMLPRGTIDFSPWDREWVGALYDGQIRKLDEQFFARLREVIEEHGFDRNTILVISADHGEELLDHGLVGHVSTYQEARLFDELIRIPLIIWAPGRVVGGRVIDEPVQCIDVMPTLLELVGLEAPAGVQGKSLLPLAEGRPWVSRPVFCATSGGGYTATPQQYATRMRAVRSDRWKLTHTIPLGETALYDLRLDPGESNDVSATHAFVADSLKSLLMAWVGEMASVAEKPLSPRSGSVEPEPDREDLLVLHPINGDTLAWQGADQSISLRWTGSADQEYTIEYDVGKGAYNLEGELAVPGNEPRYGPFHEDFWNSLTLYNPWRFRVYPARDPGAASAWVTFYLAPTASAGSLSPAVLTLLTTALGNWLTNGIDQLGQLVAGLGLAFLDLLSLLGRLSIADLAAWALIAVLVAAPCRPLVRRVGPERSLRWGLAIAYVAFVYATVPIMPSVWKTLSNHTQGAARHAGTIVIVIALSGLLLAVWRRFKGRSILPYAILAGTAICYAALLHAFSRFPAEQLHLLEYGLLAYLLVTALRLDLPVRSSYVAACAFTGVIGLVDEGIQWVLPQRYFELKDVLLNIVSGSLGLVLSWIAREMEKPDGDD